MHFNKYFSLLLLFLVFTACEEALEESPETFFNEGQIFGTEEGVEAAVNGVYSAFFDPAYYGSSLHGFIMPVSGKFWSGQGASEDATSLNTASNNTWLLRMWPAMYQAVNTANVVIKNLEEGGEGLDNRESSLGQAYFIRALTYFDLVRFFGGVPLRTVPTNIDNLHVPRSSADEIYALVISDLERARDLLPAPGEYRPERPTNLTARAYLARVFLDLASRNDNRARYEQAREEALAVVNSGEYELTPTYAELFDFGNRNTSESIFEIQYGNTGGVRNSDVIRFYTPKDIDFLPATVITFGRVRPNKETYDDHQEAYPGDPRIQATHLDSAYTTVNGRTVDLYPVKAVGNDGYTALKKYFDPTFNGTTTSRNLIHFRYADLLLMLAEIENELNGPEGAYQYVNQVLARARDTDGDGNDDVSSPANYAGLNQDEFRNRILMERQFELLGEGMDWFDSRRHGYEYFLENIVVNHNTHPTFDNRKDFMYPDDRKNMLLPLPQTELAGNQVIDVADQNPGY